ncbi:hypothetical protein L1047_12615 [Synechococcus sp. Nb3U1]|uniref:hypothetical protein n=1 Tax=Synechococcus sp. Nb3U1 TaxID=1914529 RepID=UPI001F1E4EC2|nr:hypothetical protein [Synechococcus sp. Nb3U1]MCF2972038.1 hypothetical protein [Synechococcus sp. Nb3U1]
MNQNPFEEEQLRQFLRQFRTPPPSSDLEDRILRSVTAHPLRQRSRLGWGWVGIPILVGTLLGWAGYQRWQAQVVVQETEALESFLINTWGGLLGQDGVEAETWWIELGLEGS